MNKVIVASFDTEARAYEADRALHEMHREGTLSLYDDAVVAKEPGGSVQVRKTPEPRPAGTVGGLLTGSVIGLLGGPVGGALGAGAGALMGSVFDVTRAGIDEDFVSEAGTLLSMLL